MNQSLQTLELNVFDSIESKDEGINLQTIIIPGLTIEAPLENTPAQNDETIIESEEDIFFVSEPAYIEKKQTHTELTQIPTTFENKNTTTVNTTKNIFLKQEKVESAPLKTNTVATAAGKKKAVSTKFKRKQTYRSQKPYTFAIITLVLLITASMLFVLHLNNTIDLHKISFDLYQNTTRMFSSYNKSELLERWDSLFQVAQTFK